MSKISSNIQATGEVIAPALFQNRIVCEWLSSVEAATYLGVTQNALRMMVYRRQVKFYKMGRRIRFHIKDLQALLIQKGVKR